MGTVTPADDLARRVAEHLLSREGTGPAWGIAIEEAREGYARISMTLRADMLNGHGIAHGGMIFALADTAFAYACNSRNVTAVAQAASIVFLASAKAGERLVAEAREQASSGRSAVYLVTVSTADGRKIAEFQGLSRSLNQPVLDPA
ncbi:MAG: hydroxyphenylacetyl-CoA thioesterase PaaI [Alphaproteobacteria bacterium]|nr:hydroxyphenylacetyl-CoA thioesterase PaaI [Alphaproteobacteria bacterium]